MHLEDNTAKGIFIGGTIAGLVLLGYIYSRRRKGAKFSAGQSASYDPKQLARGIEVEREHAPTVRMIQERLDRHGKLPPNEMIYESISKDHLNEFDDYYIPYLADMEKKAKKAHKTTAHYGALKGIKVKKLTKEQLKEIVKHIEDFPKPKGWDTYWDKKIWPKLRKVIKALIITGGVLSPTYWALLGGAVAFKKIANKKNKFQNIVNMDETAIDKVGKFTSEIMSRMTTVVYIHLREGNDFNKTLDALKAKHYGVEAPTIEIDWDKVDESKLFQSAIFFFDDIAPAGTGVVTATVAPTGVGAVIGSVVTAGVGIGAVGTDVYAFKLIMDGIEPAVDIKNPNS